METVKICMCWNGQLISKGLQRSQWIWNARTIWNWVVASKWGKFCKYVALTLWFLENHRGLPQIETKGWLNGWVDMCVCIYRKVNVYVCICIHTHFSIYISKYTCKWIYFPMKVILVLNIKMRMSVGVRKGLRGIKSEKVSIIIHNYRWVILKANW